MTSYLPPSSAPVRRRQAPPPIRTNSIANSAGVMAVVVAIMWAIEGGKENRRVDRAADRTDDAELKAYNEMMANLAEQDERRR